MREYTHYNDYPMADWRWHNFTPREMRCRGDNKLMIHAGSMDKLQRLRILLGRPIPINSGYRSPAYNATLDGAATNSMHLKARGYDVPMAGFDPAQFEAAARECGFTGFGFYEGSNFIHIDTGRPREWGNRWFEKAMFYGGDVPIPDVQQINKPLNTPNPLSGGKAIAAVIVAAIAGVLLKVEEILNWVGGLF